jgi:DNA-binding MarR family transcriptional regulator
MKKVRRMASPLTSANSTQPADPSLLLVPRLHVVRRMRRAFLSICRCGDTLFSPYGVTTDQYALIRAVQREPGIRQADLGAVIFAEPNTVTAMVTLLEKRGILRRRPSLTDRRAKLVHLTAKGDLVMQRLTTDWLPMRQILNECFSAPGGEKALEILDEVYEKMRVERDRLMAPSPQTEAQLFNVPLRQKKRRLSPMMGTED